MGRPQRWLRNQTLERKKTVIVLVDPNDSRAVRNKDNVLALYELMINQKSRRRERPNSLVLRTSSTTRSFQTVL